MKTLLLMLVTLAIFSSCKKDQTPETIIKEIYTVDTIYSGNDFGGDYRGEYRIEIAEPISGPFARVAFKNPMNGDTIETLVYGKGMSFQFPIFSGDDIWLKTWLLDSALTYTASVFAESRINHTVVHKPAPISQFSYTLK